MPRGDDVLELSDAIYVIGEHNPIIELNSKVHESGKYNDITKVMIIGGGKTGFYLALYV